MTSCNVDKVTSPDSVEISSITVVLPSAGSFHNTQETIEGVLVA